MLQELTIAVRTLIKRPGYALSVIATLTLGIGATTMMFSLLDGAMLRPLPFPSPRLVMLTGVFGPQRLPRGGSFPEVADWRTMNQTLDDVSIYDETSVNMRVGTESVRVETEMVSSSFFRLLGDRPRWAGRSCPRRTPCRIVTRSRSSAARSGASGSGSDPGHPAANGLPQRSAFASSA